jgi:hypothetical protein
MVTMAAFSWQNELIKIIKHGETDSGMHNRISFFLFQMKIFHVI